MDNIYQTPFSKAVLTSLFVGIMVTLICLGYNIYYREHTNFPLASIINVSSLIFAVNLIFVVVGMIYYALMKAFSKGEIVYVVLFVLLTIYLSIEATKVHRSSDQLLNSEFHSLLLVMVLIMGIAAAIGVPLLFHSRKFEEHVL